MSARQFKTLAPELLEYADRMAEDSAQRGYRIRIEKHELGQPFTPTFIARRNQTTTIVEVAAFLPFDKLTAWSNYGKSCGQDLRVIACVPHTCPITAEERDHLRRLGCGLTVVSAATIDHHIPPQDLALAVALPARLTLPNGVRRCLGSAYDQFDQAQWREGFDEACKALEKEARVYLKRWIRTGRIQLIAKSIVFSPSPKKVDRMTMGQLAQAFSQIAAKTQTDSIVEQALAKVFKDRNALAHHKTRMSTERRLRTNVGTHMYAIIEALKALLP